MYQEKYDIENIIRCALYQKERDEIIHRRNKKVIDSLLSNGHPIQLELGAGPRRMKGWTSVDMNDKSDICLDLSQLLPFPDNCVNQIYSSHLLEHFSYPHPMVSFLSECYRIMKPGCLFKVAVPNARIFLEAYLNPGKFDTEYCCYRPAFNYNSKIDYVNYMAYMAGHHRYMFDEGNLLVILSNVGFKSVRIRDFDPSLDIEKRGRESIYAQGMC